MPTLLLRLSGPMQAWGAEDSKFESRSTKSSPTKSAVIGMVAAAMGRRRDESIEDLSAFRFGVRLDQAGVVMSDYHTAHHPTNSKLAYITDRQYLQDACFVVGLEGERNLLERVQDALSHPYFPLFLGRRSCPPSGKLVLGISDGELKESLEKVPWQASKWYARSMKSEVRLEMKLESGFSDLTPMVKDVPVSFDQSRRAHRLRAEEQKYCTVRNPLQEGVGFDSFEEIRRCS